ncbi:hypothetical protein DDB_G0280577 [Dictyostelium discoideum AX4]|uniref:Uncharacterized protein n=1 Tax=Dictyostelium discoideum TaxID=44689 RepID=Q54V72_DICDI|nr:hypothetical protein DDB_G0280577 [Dictyostelium discoideum AX4]EAL67090.1 hypothetical protein DDB_G0280577 [Dictyostelium discoideum AX4]|eukprot:XP_641059.1 hypothetical protein DDB_G0280577 [Dictyostelium discoideum AX4]
MSTKETLQQKHKNKLKGAFTHEEVKEKLKKRCIDALKEKRKTEIEKARSNLLNNNNNNTNIISNNLKFTLQDQLMKLKNEQNNNNNNVNKNVNINGSESSTPDNNNNGGVEKYGNSVEFEDLDFEINQNDIDNANKALEDNYDGVEDDEDYDYLETYTLTPEEELQLLQEIQDLLDQEEDESLKIYHEMEKLQDDEIESYLNNK